MATRLLTECLDVLTLLVACSGPRIEPLSCNGHPELCDRSYAEISQAASHNAMSNADDGWLAPNQTHDIPTQLDAGVRGLMLDVHEWEGEPWLCHSICEAGRLPLVDGLLQIGAFLDAHTSEVVTVIFESYVDAGSVRSALDAAGLLTQLVEHRDGEPWPTLAELSDAGQRLVVFTDNEAGGFPGYLDEWTHAWQNAYAYKQGDTFSCVAERGDPSSPIFILNHFLTDPLASPELAQQANTVASLGEHALRCRDVDGRFPTFVTVDFADIGAVYEVVDTLNGLADPAR